MPALCNLAPTPKSTGRRPRRAPRSAPIVLPDAAQDPADLGGPALGPRAVKAASASGDLASDGADRLLRQLGQVTGILRHSPLASPTLATPRRSSTRRSTASPNGSARSYQTLDSWARRRVIAKAEQPNTGLTGGSG